MARTLLRGGIGGAASALLGGVALAGCGGGGEEAVASREAPSFKNDKPLTSLNFTAVAKSVADAVSVPMGYTAPVLYAIRSMRRPPSTGTTAPTPTSTGVRAITTTAWRSSGSPGTARAVMPRAACAACWR